MDSIPKNYGEIINIAHNDLSNLEGMTVSALMHNEIYFLGDFLEHYRKLGVKRFILLDDQSTDGSLEFAKSQSDVMLLSSPQRYGDLIEHPATGETVRAMIVWRQAILESFCQDQWSVHVDIDEFLTLPEGQTLAEFTEQFPKEPKVVYASMIDVYPANWSDIENPEKSIHDIDWYFDGRAHHKARTELNQTPAELYSGSRSRLRSKFGAKQVDEKIRRRIRRFFRRNPYPHMGTLHKPVLIYWGENFVFRSSHRIRGSESEDIILPLCHYKFSPIFLERARKAIKGGMMKNASLLYKEMIETHDIMTAQSASFLTDCSRKGTDYESFFDAGIVQGLDRSGKLSKRK